MHPYEVSSTLRERRKHESIKLNYGSLYSVVDALARHELIKAIETRQEGNRPPRTTYEITDAGATELDDWLRELIATPVKEYPRIEAALAELPVLPPETAAALLEERAEKLRMWLAERGELERWADGVGFPRLFRIEHEYHSALLCAELDYVRSLAASIRDGTLGGADVWRRMHEVLEEGVSFAEMAAEPARYLGEEAARWLGPYDEPPPED